MSQHRRSLLVTSYIYGTGAALAIAAEDGTLMFAVDDDLTAAPVTLLPPLPLAPLLPGETAGT